MLKFSQKKGLTPIKNALQNNSMDTDLRNSLWNALEIYYWRLFEDYFDSDDDDEEAADKAWRLIQDLWINYFKKPIDEMASYWSGTYGEIKRIYFKYEWYEVYDLIEYISKNFILIDRERNKAFIEYCNLLLERELSSYRIVAGNITQITSEEEIAEIEEASKSDSLGPVGEHLKSALRLLSDRSKPDYRNSIKESISAVEAVCKLVTNETRGTLGEALKKLEGKIEMHAALKKGFTSLYGYTSNADGIRHALMEEPRLEFEDAKFMLVACSAFVNYLLAKSAKANIKLK